jgi:dihydrofolate reductase
MRKLILQMQITVDGFVGGPNGEIDWVFKTMDDAAAGWIVERLGQAGLHIMGRKTFQDMSSYWPTSTEPFAAPMNEIPKGVFTQRGFSTVHKNEVTAAVKDASAAREARGYKLLSPNQVSAKTWDEAQVISGDLVQQISKLKAQPGKEILAHGGAGFAQSLVTTGLVDEYRLITHPVVLGKGLPLFSKQSVPLDLKLVEIKSFSTGTTAFTYRPV